MESDKRTLNDYLVSGPRRIENEDPRQTSRREANYDLFMDLFGQHYLVMRDKMRNFRQNAMKFGKVLKNCYSSLKYKQ
jgi:hypothetical protein